jgi:hypothetical protein
VDAGQSPGDNLESRQTFWPLLAGWLCLMLVADELAKVLSFEKVVLIFFITRHHCLIVLTATNEAGECSGMCHQL